jgi:hypothetical protein
MFRWPNRVRAECPEALPSGGDQASARAFDPATSAEEETGEGQRSA